MQNGKGFLELKELINTHFPESKANNILNFLQRKITCEINADSPLVFVRSCLSYIFKYENFENLEQMAFFYARIMLILLILNEKNIFNKKETSILIFTASANFEREIMGGE